MAGEHECWVCTPDDLGREVPEWNPMSPILGHEHRMEHLMRVLIHETRKGNRIKMATKEQEDAIAAGVQALQDAEVIEEGQLTKIVTDLEAAQTAQPSPALASAITAIGHIRDSIVAFPGSLPSATPTPTPAPAPAPAPANTADAGVTNGPPLTTTVAPWPGDTTAAP